MKFTHGAYLILAIFIVALADLTTVEGAVEDIEIGCIQQFGVQIHDKASLMCI
jgi:hypothetical protein